MNIFSIIITNTAVSDNGCYKLIKSMQNPQLLTHLDASYTNITQDTLQCLMDKTLNGSDLSILQVKGIKMSKDFVEKLLNHFSKLSKVHCGDDECYVQFRDGIVIKINDKDKGEIDLSHSKANNAILKNLLIVYASPYLTSLRLEDSNCGIDEQDGETLAEVLKKLSNKMPHLSKISISEKCTQNFEHDLSQTLPLIKVVRL
jgi:hypothetical protein